MFGSPIFVLVSLPTIFAVSLDFSNKGCEFPTVPVKCDSYCPTTCFEKAKICYQNCKSKYVCGCPSGYVRRSFVDSRCITIEECKINGGCEKPKVYASCASECQPTCDEPNPRACQRNCNARNCVCPKGLVQRSDSNTTCLKYAECPSKGIFGQDKECEKPKVYASCASECQPTCDNPKPGSCRRNCLRRHCICPPGLVQRSDTNTTCMEYKDCPNKSTTEHNKDSCEGRCDALYDKSMNCQCDKYCKQSKDCCADHHSVCKPSDHDSESSKKPTIPDSERCERRCSDKYNPTHQCQCDSKCKSSGDCCSDYEKAQKTCAVTTNKWNE